MASGDEPGTSQNLEPGMFIDILIAVVESNTGYDSARPSGRVEFYPSSNTPRV